MKLIFIRHGETEANAKRIIQGRESNKLTERGKEQAKEVGKQLKKYKIDMVFCSPLDRCIETLENILEECPINKEIFISNLLEERFLGEYIGVNLDDIDWKEIDQDNKINQEMGVESLADLKKRANLFIEDLKLEKNDSTILIVTHGDLLKIMLSLLNKKTPEENALKNAEIYEFDYDTSLDF